jgi:hypothetical protein
MYNTPFLPDLSGQEKNAIKKSAQPIELSA